MSYRCDLARIVARFTVSNAVRARARRAVAEVIRMIGENDG